MSTSPNQTGQRSFDDLYADIWRPQSIAFSQLIYQSQPAPGVVESMTDQQRAAYQGELYRLRNELSREEPSPALTRLLRRGIT